MENEEITDKHAKEENMTSESEMISSPTSAPVGAPAGLSRQGSITKNNCLCSPTNHAGSFRCRLHRTPPQTPALTLQRTKSMDTSASLKDSHSNKATSTHTDSTGSTVEAP